MLRLVLVASLSLVSGCSCNSLWGAYEVPCTRGFDCPDDVTPGGDNDLRGGGNTDSAGGDPNDMSMNMSVEMGGSLPDLDDTMRNELGTVGGRIDLK